MNKGEVFAKVQFRECCQDAAKNKKRKEGDESHGKKLEGKNISEFLQTFKIFKDTVKDDERASPKRKAERTEDEEPQSSSFYVF